MSADIDLMREAAANTGLADFAEVDGFRTGLRILLAELERSDLSAERGTALCNLWRSRLETGVKPDALRSTAAKAQFAVVTGLNK